MDGFKCAQTWKVVGRQPCDGLVRRWICVSWSFCQNCTKQERGPTCFHAFPHPEVFTSRPGKFLGGNFSGIISRGTFRSAQAWQGVLLNRCLSMLPFPFLGQTFENDTKAGLSLPHTSWPQTVSSKPHEPLCELNYWPREGKIINAIIPFLRRCANNLIFLIL